MAAVLVVDDDADVLDAISEVLLAEGFTIHPAQGGTAAIRFLQKGPAPEAILLDVRMNEVDGTSVSAFLRSNRGTRGVPIVFMTGDRNFRPAEAAQAVVLDKPFGVQELLDALHAALRTP